MLRKMILACSCICFCSIAAFADTSLRAGLNGGIGWVYSTAFSPGFNGAGLDVGWRWDFPNLYMDIELTGETAPIGAQVVLKTGAGIKFIREKNWDLGAALSAVWGLALFKPYPLFEIGMEADAEFDLYFSEVFGLYAKIGLRYLTCPEYSSRVVFYQTIDTPIGAGLVFRWK